MAVEEKDISEKIRTGFWQEYEDKEVPKLDDVQGFFHKSAKWLETQLPENLPPVVAAGGAFVLCLAGAIFAPSVLTVVAAIGTWGMFGGMYSTENALSKATEAAIEQDIQKGTLVTRYAQEAMPQEETKQLEALTQYKKAVACMQEKFNPVATQVSTEAVTTAPAVVAVAPAPQTP